MGRTKGVAIVVVLMCVALVAIIAATLVVLASNNLIYSHHSMEGLQAHMAANAGAQHAARRVAETSFSSSESPIVGTVPGGGEYSVTVTVPGEICPYVKDPLGNTPPLPPNHYYILAVGKTPNGLQRQVGWYVRKTTSLFNGAAFADDKIEMKQRAITDTWDSDSGDGTYLNTRVANAGLASVGTNSNKSNSVYFEQDNFVDNYGSSVGTADVYVGPNPATDVVKGGTAGTEFRMQRVLTAPRPMPPVDWSGAGANLGKIDSTAAYITNSTYIPDPPNADLLALKPGHYDEIDVKAMGVPMVLQPGGTYYIKKLTMGGNGVLAIPTSATETATLKLQDGLDLGGSVLINNLAHKPGLLRIESKADIEIKGGCAAYAVLYVPNHKVTLKQSDSDDDQDGDGSPDLDPNFYGSITARDVTLEENAALHYDKALGGQSTPGAGTLTIVSAQNF